MAIPPGARPGVRILKAHGDPFEAEMAEGGETPTNPEHLAVLNRLFYASTVDLGGLVEVQGTLYVCTRSGWRLAPRA